MGGRGARVRREGAEGNAYKHSGGAGDQATGGQTYAPVIMVCRHGNGREEGTVWGGVALLWEESELYELEEAKAWRPNVITFKLMTGTDRYYGVKCCIAPSDDAGTTIATIDQAMAAMPI